MEIYTTDQKHAILYLNELESHWMSRHSLGMIRWGKHEEGNRLGKNTRKKNCSQTHRDTLLGCIALEMYHSGISCSHKCCYVHCFKWIFQEHRKVNLVTCSCIQKCYREVIHYQLSVSDVYYFDRKRQQNMRTTHHFLWCLKKADVSVIQSLYLEYQVSSKEQLCFRKSKVK